MAPVDPESVTSPKLHVGNLSYEAAESDLMDLFKGAGHVESAEVVYHRDTHRSKGFAFVRMLTVGEARRAVEELHGKEFMGRRLEIGPARSTGERPVRDPA
ncbi:MAG: RNA-binding protein [Verrucomicrobiaceae bacterium]|nr:MAG: RNA-binding protein [Verrucomicrobiaceae bacterium]